MVIPPVISLLDEREASVPLRLEAVSTLVQLSDILPIHEHGVPLVHALAHNIDTCPELRDPCMILLMKLVHQMGRACVGRRRG